MRKRHAPAVALALAMGVAPLAVVSAARPATLPFEGERHLSPQDEKLALRDMPLRERRELEPLFADDRNLIVAYARRIIEFVELADGSVQPRWQGVHSREGRPLDIPSLEQAAFSEAWTPGTSLYQSLTVWRACGTCLRWNIQHFYDWQGTSGNSNNGQKDRIAVAWSNSLALKTGSYRMSGTYTNGKRISATDQWVEANEGVGWSFREWYHPQLGYYANYGRGFASIVESSFQDELTNIVAGYAHTGWGNSGGSISFGPASISFDGVDDFEWKFSVTITT